MLRISHRQEGFSLVELAVGLVIVAALLSALLVPLSTQIDQRRTVETQRLLEVAREALYGFVIANKRFPCPATAGSQGREQFVVGGGPADGRCETYRGFLPAAELGLSPLDREGFQVDAFGGDANRIRYAVTEWALSGANPTYTSTGGMWTYSWTSVGATNADANARHKLYVCSQMSAITTNTYLCESGVTLAPGQAIAIIYSLGGNGSDTEARRLEGTLHADELQNYQPAANPRVFVSRVRSDQAGSAFDDMLLWVSPHVLISRLAAANQLSN
jgi:prepilin-type N-terminal cleavage/methylation domain-containing protein